MSNGHVLTEDENLRWRSFILSTLDTLYETKSRCVLLFLFVQLYEYFATCLCVNKNKQIKVSIFKGYTIEVIDMFYLCDTIYRLRNLAVHQMYSKPAKITEVYLLIIQDPNFKVLLKEFFPDDYEEFDDLIYGYSQYI